MAALYGVETRVLNQAVRRNIRRFPLDFMFKLTQDKIYKDITICDILAGLKKKCNVGWAIKGYSPKLYCKNYNS